MRSSVSSARLVERFLPGVEPDFQRKHVLERCAAVLADIAERQIAAIHPQHDEGPRDAEDGGSLGGAQLLIFGEDRHALAAEQVGQQRLHDADRRRRQRKGLVLPVPAPDVQLDSIAICQLGQGRHLLAIPVRKTGELNDLAGHGRISISPI